MQSLYRKFFVTTAMLQRRFSELVTPLALTSTGAAVYSLSVEQLYRRVLN